MTALRDKLLSLTPTLQSETVEIKQWDATIGVRSMTAGQQASMANVTHTQAIFKAIIFCCFDPATGEQLFKEEDMGWLEGQDPNAIAPLGEVCMRLSSADDEKPVDSGKDD